MRNPAQLGKVIATVDNIAGGRVIAGLGGGWMTREFTDFGVPFLSVPERLRQLGETIELLKRMWGEEESVTYTGEFVRAENVVCQPKPPRRVPILVGGAGEKVTLRIVAKEADIWNNLASHQAALGRKMDVLRRHCDEVRRDPSEIVASQQCLVTIAPNEAAAKPMADAAARIFGGHLGDPRARWRSRVRQSAVASRSKSTSHSAARCSSSSFSAGIPWSPPNSSRKK